MQIVGGLKKMAIILEDKRQTFFSFQHGGKDRWIMKSLILALGLTAICGSASPDERTVIVPLTISRSLPRKQTLSG